MARLNAGYSLSLTVESLMARGVRPASIASLARWETTDEDPPEHVREALKAIYGRKRL